MGCSNSKSTKSLPVQVVRDPAPKKVQLNPHEEDEAAEVIDHGKKPVNKDQEALDNIYQMKKDESKTTLADPTLVSKTLIVEMPNNSSMVEPQTINNESLMNVSKIPTEKPNFEKVEHKFEFDLDLEEKKENHRDNHGIINDVIKELDDI